MFIVIGVTARGFHGINRLLDAEFWVPLGEREQLSAEQTVNGERKGASLAGLLDVTARLKPGVAGALYGIAPNDWVTFTGVPVFLATVTLVACWIPARCAATVEPQTALRHE
jgi:hypothetical protein